MPVEKPLLLMVGFYAIASFITFIVYAIDKSAAKKGAWRIKESRLHCLSLIGGWPGALLAQQKLRHKSYKQPFRVVFWLTVILNVSTLFAGYTLIDADLLPEEIVAWVSKLSLY